MTILCLSRAQRKLEKVLQSHFLSLIEYISRYLGIYLNKHDINDSLKVDSRLKSIQECSCAVFVPTDSPP